MLKRLKIELILSRLSNLSEIGGKSLIRELEPEKSSSFRIEAGAKLTLFKARGLKIFKFYNLNAG